MDVSLACLFVNVQKTTQYQCFPLLQSSSMGSRYAMYRVLCGCPAEYPVKTESFLRVPGFQNGRKIAQNRERLCRKGFFLAFGDFNMAKHDGSLERLRLGVGVGVT